MIALAALSTWQPTHNTSKPSLLEGLFDTVLSLGLCLTIHVSYEMSRSDYCCRVAENNSASSLSELQDGCGTKSVGNNWRFYSLSAAVPFASSEDSTVVLIGADSVSGVCHRANFALLCLVLLRDRDML